MPCKAQSQLANGVDNGDSRPAMLGGRLTLCRDMVMLLIKKRVRKQVWRRKDRDLACCSVALQFGESWTGDIYVATTWFLSVCHRVANSKRNMV